MEHDGGPLLVGGDVRTMSPATASILENREVIAVDQDPLGRPGVRMAIAQGTRCGTAGSPTAPTRALPQHGLATATLETPCLP